MNEIEIKELANLVANMFGGLQIEYIENPESTESIYTADSSEFLNLLNLNNINTLSMENQISDTALDLHSYIMSSPI